MVFNIKYLILMIMIIYSHSIKSFYFHLDPNENLCFSDYFADNTLVLYSIATNSTVTVSIVDKYNQTLIEKKDETKFKYSFTTFDGGDYNICVHNNMAYENTRVNLNMKTGVAAKDYSQLAKKKDLKPVELNLQKLEDKSNELIHLLSYSNTHIPHETSLTDSLIDKISYFSFFLLITMVVIGLLETVYLRSYLTNKKVI